jgi:hypothetical protein
MSAPPSDRPIKAPRTSMRIASSSTRTDAALRAERENLLDHAVGAVWLCAIMGALSVHDAERLAIELRRAGDLAGQTRH